MSGALVPAGDPALAPDTDVARARRAIGAFEPYDAAQAEARATILAFLDEHPNDACRRELLVGHLTASAIVVDAPRERVLLTHHRKLGRWLQLGGHCDGDANLAGAALREAEEESGIEGLAIEPEPVDLDVHAIPARGHEPEHLHHDVRFVVVAPEGAVETAGDESLALGWFTLAELDTIETDDSVRRLARLVLT